VIFLLRPALLVLGSGLLFVINSIVLQTYPAEVSLDMSYYFYLSQSLSGIIGVLLYNGIKLEYEDKGHTKEVRLYVVLLLGLVGLIAPFLSVTLFLILRFALSRTECTFYFSQTYFLFLSFLIIFALYLLQKSALPEYLYLGVSMLAFSIIVVFYRPIIWIPSRRFVFNIIGSGYYLPIIKRLSLDGILILMPFLFVFLARELLSQSEAMLFFKSMSVLALVCILSLSVDSVFLNKSSGNISIFFIILLVLASMLVSYVISYEYFGFNGWLAALIIVGVLVQLAFSIIITDFRKTFSSVFQLILAKKYALLLVSISVIAYYGELDRAYEYVLLLIVNTMTMLILPKTMQAKRGGG